MEYFQKEVITILILGLEEYNVNIENTSLSKGGVFNVFII